MPQKKPKLHLEDRSIVPLARRHRKEGLSSAGRTKQNISGTMVIQLNRSHRWPERFSYASARKFALGKGIQVQHAVVK